MAVAYVERDGIIHIAESAAHCPAGSVAFCERLDEGYVMFALEVKGLAKDGVLLTLRSIGEADSDEGAYAAFLFWHRRAFPGEDHFLIRLEKVPAKVAELRAALHAAETMLVSVDMIDDFRRREAEVARATQQIEAIRAELAAAEEAA